MKSPLIWKLDFSRGAGVAAVPALLALLVSGVPDGHAAPILWNRLGSNAEVLNSAFGPNLGFYGGGGYPDIIANPGYVPGVFGNALTIAPGGYSTPAREHNVVWNNVNSYLSAEHGTIEAWYKQDENPVGFSHGVYRIFDGSYGLGSGVQLDSETVPNTRLYFGLQFDGAYSSVSYDISSLNGTWLHIGAVWDRAGIAGGSDKLRLYINGNLAAATTVAGWGTVVGTQADIGGGNDANIAGKFAVDNLKVYDNAMTDFSGRFVEAIPEPTAISFAAVAAMVLAVRRSKRA